MNAEPERGPFDGLPAIFSEVVRKEGNSRYDFSVPWLDGGLVYAGDGRILVWMQAPSGAAPPAWIDPARKRVLSLAARLKEHVPTDPVLLALPDAARFARPCRGCKGTGHRRVCPSCDYDLGEHGRATCGRCDGDGREYPTEAVLVGPARLAWAYAALLRRHGITEVEVGPEAATYEPTQAIAFRHPDGWQGLVMLMTSGASVLDPDESREPDA